MNFVRKFSNYVNDDKYSMIYKNNKLDIINYSEIIDFTSSLISIRHEDKVYHIEGNNLVISRMMENEILITGEIKVITFI